MAAGFSVKDALNKNSKAGIDESPRARFRTKDISIFKMYRNTMNFYSVKDIEELAGDILLSGLKQNLELVYAPCEKGEYRIVAGERRWEALKYLVSKGYKDFELATSKLTTPQDDDEEQVEIIIANAYRTQENAEDDENASNGGEVTNPPTEQENDENGANTEPDDTSEDKPEDKVIIPQGKMRVTVVCDGSLNIRRSAAWGNDNICGRAIRGQSYYVKEIHVVDGKKMVRTIGDLYLSGESEHVQFEQL